MPPLLSKEEINSRLLQIQDWIQEGRFIQRSFSFATFMEAMAFVNQVAKLSEEMDHHPDITINYDRVTFSLTTHSIGGLTKRDFRLAGQIDNLPHSCDESVL